MHVNLQMIVLFAITAISCVLGFSIFRGKLRGPGAKTVGIMMFIGSAWMMSLAFEVGSASFAAKQFWDFVQWLANIVLPPFWLIFVLQFSGRGDWLTRRNKILMSILPIFFIVMVITNSSHELMWSHYELKKGEIHTQLVKTFEPLYWIFEIYAFANLFLGAYLTVQLLVRSARVYRYQATAVLVACLAPLVGVLMGAFGIAHFFDFDIGPITIGIATWIIAWNILRFRLIDTMRLAKETVLERMSHGVIVLYAENEIVYLNSVAEQIIGACEGDAIGSTIEKCWIEWPGGFESSSNHEEINKEITVTAGEEDLAYEVRISPLLDWRNRLVGQVVLLQDISERIQAGRTLKRYAEELKRSNQELEQFAYIASHDLQEPLRTIAGYTQLIARRYKGRLDEDADDFINFAVDGATRMQQLINDLLEYSRVETRGKPFDDTDIASILRRVISSLQVAIEEVGAKISYNGVPVLRADASQLAQLFQNLIGNAIKFRSNRPPEIEIHSEREGEEWHFAVKDNGIGIEERYYDRIFQIFQRLHSREEYPGTGIGLAVCKRIVERHGGRIWVESEPGVGSEFHFILPEKGIGV
jgi:signal transduction histidine kinase